MCVRERERDRKPEGVNETETESKEREEGTCDLGTSFTVLIPIQKQAKTKFHIVNCLSSHSLCYISLTWQQSHWVLNREPPFDVHNMSKRCLCFDRFMRLVWRGLGLQFRLDTHSSHGDNYNITCRMTYASVCVKRKKKGLYRGHHVEKSQVYWQTALFPALTHTHANTHTHTHTDHVRLNDLLNVRSDRTDIRHSQTPKHTHKHTHEAQRNVSPQKKGDVYVWCASIVSFTIYDQLSSLKAETSFWFMWTAAICQLHMKFFNIKHRAVVCDIWLQLHT